MGLLDSIFALLAFIIGLGLAIYLVWSMLGPLLFLFRSRGGTSDRSKSPTSSGRAGSSRGLRKEEKILAKVDQLLEANKTTEALKQLRKAIVLDPRLSESTLTRLKDHHQNILSRCLIIADETGSNAENIADVEHLLMQRIELQQLLLQAKESFSKLKHRREKAGKNIPSWGKSDFDQRIKQIEEELKKNHEDTVVSVDKLFSNLSNPKPDKEDDIVYH